MLFKKKITVAEAGTNNALSASSVDGSAIVGTCNSTTTTGIAGVGGTDGGSSSTASGVSGFTQGSGPALNGIATGTGLAGNYSASNNDAINATSTPQNGVKGTSNRTASNTSSNYAGVKGADNGANTGTSHGVWGEVSGTGDAVHGKVNTTGTGYAGRFEQNSTSNTNPAVYATSSATNGFGVQGSTTASGAIAGLFTASGNGTGAKGTSSSGIGGYFTSSSGTAVYGVSTTGAQVLYGDASSNSNNGIGVLGVGNGGAGVQGTSTSNSGVKGGANLTAANSGSIAGIYGADNGLNTGTAHGGYFSTSGSGDALKAVASGTGKGLNVTGTGLITALLTLNSGLQIVTTSGGFPSSPVEGQICARSDHNCLWLYISAAWHQVTIPDYSGAFPTNPVAGMRCYRSDRGIEYEYKSITSSSAAANYWVSTQTFVLPFPSRANQPFASGGTPSFYDARCAEISQYSGFWLVGAGADIFYGGANPYNGTTNTARFQFSTFVYSNSTNIQQTYSANNETISAVNGAWYTQPPMVPATSLQTVFDNSFRKLFFQVSAVGTGTTSLPSYYLEATIAIRGIGG